jgi:hypothetical protein
MGAAVLDINSVTREESRSEVTWSLFCSHDCLLLLRYSLFAAYSPVARLFMKYPSFDWSNKFT